MSLQLLGALLSRLDKGWLEKGVAPRGNAAREVDKMGGGGKGGEAGKAPLSVTV